MFQGLSYKELVFYLTPIIMTYFYRTKLCIVMKIYLPFCSELASDLFEVGTGVI